MLNGARKNSIIERDAPHHYRSRVTGGCQPSGEGAAETRWISAPNSRVVPDEVREGHPLGLWPRAQANEPRNDAVDPGRSEVPLPEVGRHRSDLQKHSPIVKQPPGAS